MYRCFVFIAFALISAGCSMRRGVASLDTAGTDQPNFRYIQTDVNVTGSRGALLCFIGLPPHDLYRQIIKDLHQKARLRPNQTLANLREDSRVTSYLGLFCVETVTIAADIIEYNDGSAPVLKPRAHTKPKPSPQPPVTAKPPTQPSVAPPPPAAIAPRPLPRPAPSTVEIDSPNRVLIESPSETSLKCPSTATKIGKPHKGTATIQLVLDRPTTCEIRQLFRQTTVRLEPGKHYICLPDIAEKANIDCSMVGSAATK